MARSILLLLLIVLILVSVSPQVQTKLMDTWKTVRPVVVASMDSVYAAVRSLVAGSDRHNRTNDTPNTPNIRFDVIVT